MATVSEALKVTEHLSITKPGRNPRVMCTSSMMFQKAIGAGEDRLHGQRTQVCRH